MENQLVPKLRFPGFEREWENIKLHEVLNYFKGFAFKSEDYVKQGERIIRVSDLDKSSIKKTGNKIFINRDKLEVYKKYCINKNHIIITTVGSKPHLIESAVGRPIYIHNDNEGLLNQNLLVLFSDYNRAVPFFYYSQMLGKRYLLHIENIQRGNANQSNITVKDLLQFKVFKTYLPEQQKIADYLSSIDAKLNLLEEKKAELSRYKKAMMQKLFSQEIRFKDENGKDFPDWEEKKLGDVFSSYNGLTGKTKENFGFGKPYIKYTQVFNDSRIKLENFDLVKINENEIQNKVAFGDAFFTVSSETPHEIGMSSVLLNEVEEVYLNSFCFALRPKLSQLNPFYYRYFFRSQNFRTDVVKLAQGSTRYNMSKVEFIKINIGIPSLPEQQKIADFLSVIDDNIDKVEEQIQQTQAFKKAMLQQMFV